jgi:hypothetical protein
MRMSWPSSLGCASRPSSRVDSSSGLATSLLPDSCTVALASITVWYRLPTTSAADPSSYNTILISPTNAVRGSCPSLCAYSFTKVNHTIVFPDRNSRCLSANEPPSTLNVIFPQRPENAVPSLSTPNLINNPPHLRRLSWLNKQCLCLR